MREVTIPNDYNPFVVKVNNVEYFYKAGETVEVPDEVAEVIDRFNGAKVPEPEKLEYVEGFSYDPVADAGKVLQIRDDGRGIEWGANSGGGGGIVPLETYTVHITAPAIEGFYFNVYNVTDTADSNTYLCYAVVDDDNILLDYNLYTNQDVETDVTIAKFRDMLEGGPSIYCPELEGYHAVVSGGVEFRSSDGWVFIITGDGTIEIVAD